MTKPEKWSDPDKKLFPHQVGFTAPPMDFDAAPSDFLRMCPETVGVHGRLLHAPDYAHRLSDRAGLFHLLEETVHCLSNGGADVVGQVANWVHASGTDGVPRRFVSLGADIEEQIGVPVISSDISLYWRIFRTLGVAPLGRQGSLLASLQSSADPEADS